jgi:predicted enzyme related to lactoylglutathione lyase
MGGLCPALRGSWSNRRVVAYSADYRGGSPVAHAPGEFCWFECASTDPARARAFYAEVFGWDAVERPMPGGGGTYTLLRQAGDDLAGLYDHTRMAPGVPSHWAAYVAVRDCDAIARRARDLGGKVITDPMDVPGVGRIAFVQDPTGATLGIAALDPHPGTSAHGPFGWCELATDDTARAATFYTGLFGWHAKADAHSPYTEFQVGGRSIGGMLPMPAPQAGAPAYWLPYVLVEDCDRTVKRVAASGGRILVPATHIDHVGWFTVFADPAGAALAAIRLEHL